MRYTYYTLYTHYRNILPVCQKNHTYLHLEPPTYTHVCIFQISPPISIARKQNLRIQNPKSRILGHDDTNIYDSKI